MYELDKEGKGVFFKDGISFSGCKVPSKLPDSISGTIIQPDDAMAKEFLNFVYETFQRLSNPAQLPTANPVDYMTGQRFQFQRDLLYFRATTTLAGKGDFDKALLYVGKVSDADFRGGLDSLVRFQAATALLNKGEFDSAIRYAQGISDGRQRAFLLAKIARSLFNKNEPVRAAEVLADAVQTIGKSDEGEQKAHALLLIAETESRIDPRRGFEVMEATTKAFNDADFKAEEKPSKAAPGAGLNLSFMLTQIFKLETPDLAPGFSLLARNDFNRALLLAQTLKKKDRTVLAQLAVCRSILTPKPGKKM
jgi:tetratricopeptide (TPR) repeat protein